MTSVFAALMIGFITAVVLLGFAFIVMIAIMGGASAVAVRRQKREVRSERSHLDSPRWYH